MLKSATLQTIICTSKLPEAERFYSDVLGLPLVGRSHGALVYDVGGGCLRVSPVPAVSVSDHTVMGFAVPELAPVMDALSARGVEWVRFPNFVHDENGMLRLPDGTKVAWFRDPDGNLLSVVQYAVLRASERPTAPLEVGLPTFKL